MLSRERRFLHLLPFLATLGGCDGDGRRGSPDADAGPVTDRDASVTSDDAGPPAEFTSVRLVAEHERHVVERVTYRSGALEISGQICRPRAAGPHPVLLFNHGGFAGLGAEWDGDLCAAAGNGHVIAMSSYRGEDGSDGRVEVCLGEVDDALALLAVARAQPYADPTRVVMIGGSHGGCITLRALARGAQVTAAVDLFGAVHWEAIHVELSSRLAAGTAGDLASVYREILDQLEASTGGTPDQVPAAYAARSPFEEVAALDAVAPDLMILHGAEDAIVATEQSCALAGGLSGLTAHHVLRTGEVTTAPPPRCTDLTWSGDPLPRPNWPGHRQLAVYDGAGHGLDGEFERPMLEDALAFALDRL